MFFAAGSFMCDFCCWELSVWFVLFKVLYVIVVAGSFVCDVKTNGSETTLKPGTKL